MGFIRDWLFGEPNRKPVLVNLPPRIIFATETLVFLINSRRKKQVRFDTIVALALNEYINNYLNVEIDEDESTENVVDFPPPSTIQREVYTRGRSQSH
jgi:hypothetical protein